MGAVLLDIDTMALSGCANPTFATIITPTSWAIVDADGLGSRRRGGRDGLVTVNTNQVATQIMFTAK